MIKVSMFRQNNQINAFEISGHADSGPFGYDLVCAGVSAVSFGAVNGIVELCKLDLEIKQEDSGYIYVALPHKVPADVKEKAHLLLEAMLISLQTIEREYSQFIEIHMK